MTARLACLSLSLVVAASVANAAPLLPPKVLELAEGYGGPEDDQGGAGNEQPSVAIVDVEGKKYAVTIFMSSDVDNGDRPWQCKCSSVELDPIEGPRVVADRVQLTALEGNRPCNHPKAASDGETVIWTFGSNNPDLANVRTYVAAVDYMCNEVGAPFRVSENGNNNEGAPDIAWNGGSFFTGGYLSTGGEDRTYALGLNVSKDPAGNVTFEKTFLRSVVTPANIGRPTILPMGANRSLVCAAKGDQRPPEDGVECGMLDTTSGQVLWRELVAPSNEQQEIYMNQPQLARIDENRVALMVIESRGQGRKDDNKSPSITHIHTLKPDDTGAHMESTVDSVGPYQAHATICSGLWGEEGTPAVGLFDASITGGGLAKLTLTKWDDASAKLQPFDDRVVGSHNGDSGYIANIYGQNPGTQGRDFLRCIGDVPNPGFGVAGGFMPEVKTFFLAPYNGRKPGEPKNAMFLSLVPAQLAPASEPEPTPTPGTGGEPTNPTPSNPSSSGGAKSGCSVGGLGPDAAATAGSVALLAYALAESLRRRLRSRREDEGGVS